MPKDIDVTIVATLDGNDVQFEMKEQNQYTEIIVFNKDKDKLKKNDHYLVQFHLDDQTGKGLKFDQNSPMYLSKGSATHIPKCPKNGNVGSSQGFSTTPNSDGTLTVRNDDMDVCFYKFALNFRDRDNNPHQCDPIYGNQNGGQDRFFASALATGFLCGAAGGAAATGFTAAATSTSVLTGAAIGAVVGIIAALILGMLGGSSLSGAQSG